MRNINYLLITLTFIFSNMLFGQKVVVKGFAIDSTKGKNAVYIVINDTVNKLLNKMDRDNDYYWSNIYFKMYKRKKLYSKTKNKGYFNIRAKLTDTITFSSNEHNDSIISVRDLIKNKSNNIKLSTIKCNYKMCSDSELEYIIIIGSKINVNPANRRTNCGKYSRLFMDSFYDAKYKVDTVIKGNFKENKINFSLSDHYGRPEFCKYENVILFLVKTCTGKFIHQKYQFYDCYRTVDNKWAIPYKPLEYSRIDSSKIDIKLRKIEFKNQVEYDIKGFADEIVKERYPEPYYKIINNKAVAVYGNYIDEMLEIKTHISIITKEKQKECDEKLKILLKK